MLKILRKAVIYLLVTLLIFVSAGSISLYLYEDEIVQHLIRQANERIKTPIHVDDVELTWWANFPDVSLVFTGVLVEENKPAPGILAQVEQVDIAFSIWNLLQKDYTISNVSLRQGEVKLEIDESGRPNYNIIEKSEAGDGIDFALQKVNLDGINFKYTDILRKLDYDLNFESTSAQVDFLNNYYLISVDGEVLTNKIAVRHESYLNDKFYRVSAKLNYSNEHRRLTIDPSQLEFQDSKFTIEGTYSIAEANEVELEITGENTSLQTILSFLPSGIQEKYSTYESQGDAHFKAQVSGMISANEVPSVHINFGISNGSIFHANSKSRIENANLTGTYNNVNLFDLKSADLNLQGIRSLLDGKEIVGDLRITNFVSPTLSLDLSGGLGMQSLVDFYPIEALQSAQGAMDFAVVFSGKLDDLKSQSGTDRVEVSGDIDLNGIDLTFKNNPVALTGLGGNLVFNGHDLALNGVSGKLGKSDFQLQGFFRNILAYLFFDDQDLGIEADLKSDLIDLDELLSAQNGNPKSYTFSISPKLFLSFDCDIKSLRFRRLEARNISGELKVKDQLAVGRNIRGSAMGGDLAISGMVNARNPDAISVDSDATLRNISIDQVFYVFENFSQEWLIDENLKGRVFADVSTEMTFDDKLRFKADQFVSDIGITIHDGQLNNFEPMQKLSRYVDDADLSRLRFSELKNEIHIEDKTIFLPEMQVSSNITTINISGTHTFAQQIDYRVVVPLTMKESYDKDEIFGAIENDGTGKSKLHLKITGTTSDYKITYDVVGVKNKIVADLKKEVLELKTAFKTKGQKKKKTLELNEDEYFDWDEAEEKDKDPKKKKNNNSL